MIINQRIVKLLLFFFCICLVPACSSKEEKKQVYYQNALNYIKEKKRDAAIIELRNAIQIDAKYGEARYQLGLLYLEAGDGQKAFGELVRAADLNPDNLDANLKVAQFYLLSQKKDESRKRVDHILAKDPNHRDALTLLANLELSERKFAEALAALGKIGKDVDTSDELQNLKGRIYAAQQQWDAAEEAFQKAIALNGDNFIHYKTLLFLYESKKDKAKAKNLLDEIIKKFPDDPQAHLLLAGYHRGMGEMVQVEEELKKVIEIDPKNPRFRLQLSDFYRQIGKIANAEETLVKARSDIEKNPDLTASLATLYFDQKQFDKAKTLLDELNAESPGHGGEKLLKARFLQKEGKVRDGIVILQSLNTDFPNWADPFFHLGLAHYSLGEIDLAKSAVATAIQKDGSNPRYHTLMAQLFDTQGAFEDAKKEAATALRLDSKNLRAAIILTRALIGTKQYDKAVTLLSDMKRQVPGNKEILGNLALAYFGAKELSKGEETLNELLKIDPGHIQAIGLLIGVKYKDDLPGAETLVRRQIEQAPADFRLYLMLGGLLERQKKDQEALSAYKKAQELNLDNPQSHLAAAKLLARLGKKQEAMAEFNVMIGKDAKSIPGHMGIAALLEAEGDTTKAMEQYNKILEIKEDYAPAANNLAWLIASDPNGDLGKALLLAMAAKQAFPDSPEISDTLGWVYYHRKAYPLAIAQFELALQGRPDSPVIEYHLALALSGNNQKEDAVKTLEKLLARKTDFSERKKAEELLAELKKG
jgi:tetratricopeptide (TPR) repeat protein